MFSCVSPISLLVTVERQKIFHIREIQEAFSSFSSIFFIHTRLSTETTNEFQFGNSIFNTFVSQGRNFWSTRPTTVPAGSDHYFHTACPSVRPKTSESSDNHCRPGLWAGRVDHWWLLSCTSNFLKFLL